MLLENQKENLRARELIRKIFQMLIKSPNLKLLTEDSIKARNSCSVKKLLIVTVI